MPAATCSVTALCLALTPVLKVCSSDIDALSPLIEPLRMADTQQCRTKPHPVLSSAAQLQLFIWFLIVVLLVLNAGCGRCWIRVHVGSTALLAACARIIRDTTSGHMCNVAYE